MQKWAIFRKIINFVIDTKIEILRKRRFIFVWVQQCKAHHRARMAHDNFRALAKYKEEQVFKAMNASRIKRVFKKRVAQLGPNVRERMHRSIPHKIAAQAYPLNKLIEPRSKDIMVAFLKEMMKQYQLSVKMRQAHLRLTNVQKSFIRYFKTTKAKTEILKHLFSQH